MRRKRGRPPKSVKSRIPVGPGSAELGALPKAALGPSELEVYCSVSNVSPDSGIYCVAGSPWHQPGSPAHSPQHPPQLSKPPTPPRAREPRNGKRPAKAPSSRRPPALLASQPGDADKRRDSRVPPIDGSDNEPSPSPSPVLSAPARRGPGRPKKAPPVLEPCLPLQPKPPEDAARRKRKDDDKLPPKHKKELHLSASAPAKCDKGSMFPELSEHRDKSRKRSAKVGKGQEPREKRGRKGERKGERGRKRDRDGDMCDRLVDAVRHLSAKSQQSSRKRGVSNKKKLPAGVEKQKKGRRRGKMARLAAEAEGVVRSSGIYDVKARSAAGPSGKPHSGSSLKSSHKVSALLTREHFQVSHAFFFYARGFNFTLRKKINQYLFVLFI